MLLNYFKHAKAIFEQSAQEKLPPLLSSCRQSEQRRCFDKAAQNVIKHSEKLSIAIFGFSTQGEHCFPKMFEFLF